MWVHLSTGYFFSIGILFSIIYMTLFVNRMFFSSVTTWTTNTYFVYITSTTKYRIYVLYQTDW